MNHVTHWLGGIAQRAGLRVADRAEYATATLEEVWLGVCEDSEIAPLELAETGAVHFRLEVADLGSIDSSTIRLVPHGVAREFQVMPLRESYHTLMVATADPTNLDAEQAVAFASGRTIEFAVAPPIRLQEAVDAHYAPERVVEGLPSVAAGAPEAAPKVTQVSEPVQQTDTAEPAEDAPVLTPSVPQLPASSQTDTSGGPTPTKVLIVDDDPVSRTIARSLLEADGIGVTEAGDGMGAIQALAAGMQFDLCVLDLNMPNVDGRQVLQEIRSSLATAAMPVIVLTGSNDAEAEIELMQAGADDYIRKPLDAARFMVRVKATLRRAGHDTALYGGAA